MQAQAIRIADQWVMTTGQTQEPRRAPSQTPSTLERQNGKNATAGQR